ncbi:hypothetical protein V6N11_069274 [Hibiscus sabdariffa]|uniref:Zinc finger PHD-type domain-containing protein n=1 Tax=Hibiscus sabdariffa TaxID=183260 RepID=A0ABR1Z771_9ROSI
MFMREKLVEHNANALAAGRILGVDAIEQITSRCIRIVENFEAELSGCALCRACDFSKSGFGPRTIILCDQCEKEYHIGCLRTDKMADLRSPVVQQEIPKGKWFCCSDCSRIHSTLQRLLNCGAEKLPDSLLNVIRKKYVEKGLDADINIDVRWRLLSGRFASPETRLFLSQAVSIFHECFDPIVDVTTGPDLIPCMVYGRNLKGQEYGGMYCAVLTINSFVVSAGIIRIFGQQIAELPLVATGIAFHGKSANGFGIFLSKLETYLIWNWTNPPNDFKNILHADSCLSYTHLVPCDFTNTLLTVAACILQGYFQLLFSCIEKLLGLLNVKNIVLLAAKEAESIWTDKFDFRKLTPDQLGEYRKSGYQMVIFKGTSVLLKQVPPCQVVNITERAELHNDVD